MAGTLGLLLALSVSQGGTTVIDAAAVAALPSRTADATAAARRAAALLEDRYVDATLGRRYADALRAHAARGDYRRLTSPAAIAERLTADLQRVAADGHLRFYPVGPTPPAPSAAVASSRVEAAPRSGITAARWIEPGVAYIAFDHFDDRPGEVAALTRFLREHAGARALVIDSRANGGGAFDMLGVFGNHLFAAPRLLANMDMAGSVVAEHGAPFPIDGSTLRRTQGPAGLVRFQHWAVPVAATSLAKVPVYYLTSRRTFSAAEHLAMVLKSTGRATLIGETTGGGNHFGGTEQVGAGLELFVPVGHTTDPTTGKDWERTGIAPHVAVPADAALDEALRRIRASTRTAAISPAPSSAAR